MGHAGHGNNENNGERGRRGNGQRRIKHREHDAVAREPVKLRIKPRDAHPGESLPGAECPWALPLVANRGAGTYEINNGCIFYPLTVGDSAEARLDGYSMLRVTKVKSLRKGLYVLAICPMEFTREQVQEVAAHFSRAGCAILEGGLNLLSMFWDPGVSKTDVMHILMAAPVDGLDAHILSEDERRRELEDLIDPVPDMGQSQVVDTNYFAADDPVWGILGMDSPGHLTTIQRFVHSEPGVLASIRKGNHEKVVGYIDAVMAWDPRDPQPVEFPELDAPWPGMR